MNKASNIILIILCLTFTNMSSITLISKDPQIVTAEYDISHNMSLKGTDSNYTFSGFYDFLTQYGNSTEIERPIIIKDYITWQETDGGGFPAIQNDSHVVFIYYNETTLIDSCAIIGDFSAHNAINMSRLGPGVSFFYYSLSNNVLQFPHTSFEFIVEPTTRIDYFFIIDGGDEVYLDPRNPRQSPFTFGQNASELAMPQFQQPLEIIHRSDIPHGNLTTLQAPWHNPKVQIYLPPNYDPLGSYPTMYTGDGSYYITLMSADDVLDNLIADQRIEPIIAVFIDHKDADPNDPNNSLSRFEWYNCNPEYLTYLDSLVTYIDANFATNPSAYARLHLGFSISALTSAYVILERPSTFKLLASQSGSYPIGEASYEIMTKYTQAPNSLDLKAWFSVGKYEDNNNFNSPMVDDTKNMVSIFDAKGWSVNAVYNPECHSFGAWRHILDDMLEYFFSEPITKLPTTSTQTQTTGTQRTTSTSKIQENTRFPAFFVLLPLLILIYCRKRNLEQD
jgi:enterochelin esterase family protein